MEQAYAAGMRDAKSDAEAQLKNYKLSIIGDFQKQVDAMQVTNNSMNG
jgi:hypothetical protein